MKLKQRLFKLGGVDNAGCACRVVKKHEGFAKARLAFYFISKCADIFRTVF